MATRGLLPPFLGIAHDALPYGSFEGQAPMHTKASDPARIDIHDQAERARWAERLGISEAKLCEVVRKFGTRPSTVRATLGLPPS